MKLSHLGKTLAALMSKTGETTSAIAARAQVTQPTISRLADAARRIDVETLRSLCATQMDPRDGLEILIAHLRDEIDRSGRLQTEIQINADERTTEADIRLLAEASLHDPQLRGLLAQMADFLRSHPLILEDNDLASGTALAADVQRRLQKNAADDFPRSTPIPRAQKPTAKG